MKIHTTLPPRHIKKMAKNLPRDHEAAVFSAQDAAPGRHWQFLMRVRFHHFSDTGTGELALPGHPWVGPGGFVEAGQYAPAPGFHEMPAIGAGQPPDGAAESDTEGTMPGPRQ